MKQATLTTKSIGRTSELAAKLAKNVKGGEIICLIGELGVGKTHFVKFFAEALGVAPEEVISPTFVYWRKLKGKDLKIDHFDFFRLENGKSIEEIGLLDAINDQKTVTVIEWADKVASYLPEDRFEISIVYLGETEREIDFRALGPNHTHLLSGLEE